jgi:hypothetical protein
MKKTAILLCAGTILFSLTACSENTVNPTVEGQLDVSTTQSQTTVHSPATTAPTTARIYETSVSVSTQAILLTETQAVTVPTVRQGAVTTPTVTQGAVTTPTVTQGAVTTPTVTQNAVTVPTVTQRTVATSTATQTAVTVPTAMQAGDPPPTFPTSPNVTPSATSGTIPLDGQNSRCRFDNSLCCGSGHWGSMGRDGPLWTKFCSLQAYERYARNNSRVLPDLLVPRVPLPGFELSEIAFIGEVFVSLSTVWTLRNSDVTVRYNITTYANEDIATQELVRFSSNRNAMQAGERIVYQLGHYCSVTNEFFGHSFNYLDNDNRLVSVSFSPEVDLSLRDMIKHLDLVSVA